MGFRRLGCLLFILLDFRVFRLGIFINLFVGDLLFFFFCCIKNNICEDSFCIRIYEKIGIVEDINLVWENFRSFLLSWDVKMN